MPELGLNVSFNLDEWRAWADFYNAVLVHEWGHKEVTNSILGVDHYIDGFGESCDGFEYSRASCDSNLYQNSVQYNASLLDTLENSQLEYDSNNTNPVGLPSEYLE